MQMRRAVASVVVMSALCCAAMQSQTAGMQPRKDAAEIPSYAVVSIHKSPDPPAPADSHDTPDGYMVTSTTLRSLIAEAYGFSLGQMNKDQMTGEPAWAKTQLFDVRAKVDAEDVAKVAALEKAETMIVAVRQLVSRTPGYRMVMLQRLLEDRFQLKIHYEQKVMALYEMELAKGGLRMKAAHPDDPEHGSIEINDGRMTAENAPMGFLPAMFAMELEKPVEDKTGIEGNYDFKLSYMRMNAPPSATGDTAPSLFTAVEEQLGLKLRASKGPVWVIVVDHAELPSDN